MKVCLSITAYLLVFGIVWIHCFSRRVAMILDTSSLGECDRQIQHTHCIQLIQSFHQQQIQLVKVLVNQVLREVILEEDTAIEASVMRHVLQFLIQNDDSDTQ
jgi:hypothetical protein